MAFTQRPVNTVAHQRDSVQASFLKVMEDNDTVYGC